MSTIKTIRLPITQGDTFNPEDRVELTPEHIAQLAERILGDLPAKVEALRKAFLSVPHPATAEVLRVMEADAPQQDAKPSDGVDANDAPEGYTAKVNTADCTGCAFEPVCGGFENSRAVHPCIRKKRKDGYDVIFVKQDAKLSLTLNPHGPPAVGNGAGCRMERDKPDADEAAVVEALASVKWSDPPIPNYGVVWHHLGQYGARAIFTAIRDNQIGGLSATPVGYISERWHDDQIAALRRELAEATEKGRGFAEKCDRLEAELAEEKAKAEDFFATRTRMLDELEHTQNERDKALAELAASKIIGHECVTGLNDMMDKLRAELAAERERTSLLSSETLKLKDDLAAATERAEKYLQCHGDVPCGACITCLNGLLSEARADADALAEVVGRVIEWVKVPGNRIATTILNDGRAALAAHDARRGK